MPGFEPVCKPVSYATRKCPVLLKEVAAFVHAVDVLITSHHKHNEKEANGQSRIIRKI